MLVPYKCSITNMYWLIIIPWYIAQSQASLYPHICIYPPLNNYPNQTPQIVKPGLVPCAPPSYAGRTINGLLQPSINNNNHNSSNANNVHSNGDLIMDDIKSNDSNVKDLINEQRSSHGWVDIWLYKMKIFTKINKWK